MMNSNQPNAWRSLGLALTLAFLLGLFMYLTLVALPAVAAGPPLAVTLAGATAGTINTATPFTAIVTPTTTTLPITYTWQATEQSQVTTTTSTLSHTVVFAWATPGAKTITVTAANASDAVTAPHVITVDLFKIYLPIIVIAPNILVDNFDDGQDPNELGGYSSTAWPVPCPPTITGTYYLHNAYSGAYSYRLEYNVTPICYGVWQTDLRDLNFSNYSTLTVWIKGASGGEHPRIYLQDNDDCQHTLCRHFVDVGPFLPAGQVTTEWQQARIPLSVFAAYGVNLTRLRFFQVVFEHNNMSGVVYIDEIRFW